MDNKITTIAIALVLGVLILSGCENAATQAGEEWKVYRNDMYGYSFEYPSDCTLGPLPGDCKKKPPEERSPECLCYLNAENPGSVSLGKHHGEADKLTLAGLFVSHHDTPVFNPPPGKELVPWFNENFAERYEEFPAEPNMEIDGIQAMRIYSPQSPMAPSFEDIYFIKNDILFQINLLDVDDNYNRELYDQLLSTFSFEE